MTPEELTALAWEKVKDVKTNWKKTEGMKIVKKSGGYVFKAEKKKRKKS